MPRLTHLAIVLLLTSLAPAADWARFRGPNGTGIVDDKTVPIKWAKDNTLFSVAVPGVGHSSPIITGERLFLLSATKTERLVLCYDANTGKQLWSKAVPGKVGKTHLKSSLASATPCSDGERVYCVFWDGAKVSLFAYSYEGKLEWTQDLGKFTSQHGPGFSPMLVDGKVIVSNDQDGKAMLQAFHAKDGKPAWEAKREAFRASYSTPIVITPDGKKELIVTSTAGITSYNPEDGTEKWNYRWSFPAMPLRTVGSSIVAEGMVFGCAGDGSGARGMIAVKLGGKGDVTKTHLVWSLDSSTPYVPTILAKDQHLYTVTDDGIAICREAKTGKEVWRGRLGGPVSASPVMIDGKVYAITEKGDVTIFTATPKGFETLAKNSVGEKVMSSPAVANGKLYIRTTTQLICIGAKK